MLCPKCGADIPHEAESCPACGWENSAQGMDKYQGFGMRWYRCMVFFGLWASALVSLGTGVCIFTGWIYDGDVQSAYARFGLLRYLDRTAGVLFVLNAVLFMIAAIRMLRLKKGAPTLTTVCYAANIVLSLVYVCIFYARLHTHFIGFGELFFATVAYTLIPSVILLGIHLVYFKKRAVLFVR